jgi:hypothetical protein
LFGQAYWSVTPVTRRGERTSGGIPIGFEEDSAYLGSWQRHLLQAVLAVPSLVRLIDTMETFRYVTLLFLLRSRSLALISIWNPTFLILLVDRLWDWWPQLATDIANGTLSPPTPLVSDLQRHLTTLIRPDHRRAVEIRTIFQANSDPAIIHTLLWPRLRLISCWTEAQAALYAPELARLFPQANIQGKGLIATEGFVSLPLVGQEGSALAIRSHFFEFLPQAPIIHDSRFTIQSQRPPVGNSQFPLLAHELQPNGHYAVVLTTGGGLYRYQLQDRVQVVGYMRSCPLLRFLGKEAYLSDWFGEKLNERHVRQVLDELFTRYAIRPTFAMLACDAQPKDRGTTHLDSSHFAYTLYIEVEGVPEATLKQLGDELEAALQEAYHYRYCRDLGQLGALRVFRIDNGALEAYLSACQAHGQRAGDIKPVALHGRGGWSQVFQGRMV